MIEEYRFSITPGPQMTSNVKDIYKKWTQMEIRADLDDRRTDMVNVFMHLTSDFNVSSGIRSNNAFLGNRVYVVGRRQYDKRGCVGTHKFEHVYHADDLREVVDVLHDDCYTVYAVDNVMELSPREFWDVDYPRKSAFVYGEEQRGLSKDEIRLCDDMVYVSMPGSVRSLNVACAASVIMAEYSRQHRNAYR